MLFKFQKHGLFCSFVIYGGVPIRKTCQGRSYNRKKETMQTIIRYGIVPIGNKHSNGGVTIGKKK